MTLQEIKEQAILEASKYGLGIIKSENTVIGINKNNKYFVIYDPETESIGLSEGSKELKKQSLWEKVKQNLEFNRLVGIPSHDELDDFISKTTEYDKKVIHTVIKAINKDLVLFRRDDKVMGYDTNDLSEVTVMEHIDENADEWDQIRTAIEKYEPTRYTHIDQNQTLENQLKRLQADYANLKKRAEDEKIDTIKFANEKLLKNIIELYSEFELATRYFKDEGYTKLVDKFTKFLEKEDISIIDPTDQEFDPYFHEAIEKVNGEQNKIIKVYSKVFLLNGKLLKPAFVAVGDGEDK